MLRLAIWIADSSVMTSIWKAMESLVKPGWIDYVRREGVGRMIVRINQHLEVGERWINSEKKWCFG